MAKQTQEVERCFALIADTLTAARSSLSKREAKALQAGLSASHAEEALTQGDIARAKAHFSKLIALVRELKE
jgi:hypothetical protein